MTNPKIGGFFPIDKNGNIVNPTSLDLIPNSLDQLLDEIIQLYKENEGQNLHSVWLRGSTPRGFFVEKYSDIDIFALVKTPNIRWKKANWADNAENILKTKFNEIPDIEWAVSSWYPDFYQKNSRLSFYIKTQSLLLFGKDISYSLPDFKISDEIKMNSTWLKEDVAKFMQLEQATTNEIRTILKLVIRAAYESVMEKEGRYTPDLYWCAEVFGRHCVEGKKPVFELLKAFEIENNDTLYLKENIRKVIKLIV